MVTRVILWDLKDEAEGGTKEQNAAIIKERLEALVGVIPGLRSLKVRRRAVPTGMDLCMVGEFDDLDALNVYREHPRHKELTSFVLNATMNGVVCDFED